MVLLVWPVHLEKKDHADPLENVEDRVFQENEDLQVTMFFLFDNNNYAMNNNNIVSKQI